MPASGDMEMIVPTVPEGEIAPFNPEVDLSRIFVESGLEVLEIGEIKLFDDAGNQRGEARKSWTTTAGVAGEQQVR
jgi:hypothetical protein